MKTALAIVCSLLLVWTQFVQAQAAGAGEVRIALSCCSGDCECDRSRASCCTADSLPESRPVSATPVTSSSQNQVLSLGPTLWVWTLPEARDFDLSFFLSSSLIVKGAPLYERDCAHLI
jgi:hypothetical protein